MKLMFKYFVEHSEVYSMINLVTKTKRLKQLQDQLAEIIQSILVRKGWSQQDLADRLHKNKSHISQILHSKANLTLGLIVEIEVALGERIMKLEKRK